MKKLTYLAIVFSLLCGITWASDNEPELKPIEIKTAYIPIGFDDNDQTEVVVAGVFPTTCYQVGPYKVDVDHDAKQIRIRQQAYVYDGICIRVFVPFQQTIKLGMLDEGGYEIVDASSGNKLGSVPIAKATHPGPGTDDFPYAPVSDAFVQKDPISGGLVARLTGYFTSNCMKFKKVLVRNHPQVLVVLPIVELVKEARCVSGTFPFDRKVALPPLIDKSFLLHVRSMNGQAINKLYADVFWKSIENQ